MLLCISAQSGKTEALWDCVGQRFDQRPTPTLYVGPTKQFLHEQLEPRLVQLLETPTLAEKLANSNTKTRKVIGGVQLRLAHGGSSSALKSDPFGFCISDEVDELLANVKGQGDPIGLIQARGDSFPDFVHAMTSTPSKGIAEVEIDPVSGLGFWKVQDGQDLDSAIWSFWQAGTRYHWTWRCPHCSLRFVPRFEVLAFKGKDSPQNATVAEARDSAVIICPRNGCVIEDRDREAMNATGVYVAPGQSITEDDQVVGDPPESETCSFWVSGLCSPFRSLGDRAASYLEAVQSGNLEKIQTVVNAGFGELWAPMSGEAPEWTEVAALREPYGMGEVPEGVRFLTCGVDVQKNRLVYVVRGFGLRQESWLIEHGEVFGDTRTEEVWQDLYEQVLDRDFGRFRIMRAFIDSGFRPNPVGDLNIIYSFCLRFRSFVFACKGWDVRQKPVSSQVINVTPSGKMPKVTPLVLWHLDSNYTRSWVHQRIRWPKEQPGGFHLPQETTEQYCRELVNEAQTPKPSAVAGGLPKGYIWISRGPHDYLDAEAMAYGAAKSLGVDRPVPIKTSPPPEPPTETPPPPSNFRRDTDSGWLSGRTGNNWLTRR